ncbi:ROK family protein [Nonomuraea sp. NPDC059194]|uniref:ROK family transcriptional regulator n=1 Tax=Nonomuraea sp. NPDC059194 TaxID=3346764 RepID=UPI0036825FDE
MRQVSGDASLLRKLNSAALLRVMRGSGDATLTELARAARVSRPTAEGIVEDLLAEGWAEECEEEQGDRQRGRPARRYRFRASAGHVVGVGIGSSSVRTMAADLGGAILASCREPLPRDAPVADRLAMVRDLVVRAAAQAGREVSELVAVGVGTTGVVDGEGRVVKSIVLPGWSGLELRAELERRLPAPILVENDMRLAVLAEHWRGAAQGRDNVVYLFTGDRLGLGFLIGGVPYRGANAASGEIGVQAGDHWSAFRHVLDYAMAAEPGELRSTRESAEFAIARARAGDAQAMEAVSRFARHLAGGLVSIVNPLDPEMVVIGGSLSTAGDLLVGPIQSYLDEACLYPPRVVASELSSESITLGALRMALNHADTVLFS